MGFEGGFGILSWFRAVFRLEIGQSPLAKSENILI